MACLTYPPVRRGGVRAGTWRALLGAVMTALALVAAPAHAGLFDDDEARRAILDLRSRLDKANEENRTLKQEQERANEQITVLKQSLLELNNQIELMRGDVARLRGTDEQVLRDVSELQRRQRDIAQGVEERVARLEPQRVSVDGKEFDADPEERRVYEAAIASFRTGDFGAAASALSAALQRWPGSGYADSATFWLGNAQYGQRRYREAIASFNRLVKNAPTHPRSPEALLSIANCYAELKDRASARRSIDELIKAYPDSEAASAGRERLASLRG